jgi:hypothetical protein
MEDNQVYVQGDFSFIKNDDLRKLFEKSYVNDNETKTNNSDMYSWARKKIDEITDDCWRSFVDTFDENKVLEEYNGKSEKLSFEYDKKSDNDGQIYIQDNKVTVPVAGKRKTRKSKKLRRKSRKSRRKIRKSMKKSKK